MTLVDGIVAQPGSDVRFLLHPGIASFSLAAPQAILLPLATELSAVHVRVELANAAVATRAAFDPLATMPVSARELMSRVTIALDPARRFVGARLSGGA